MLSQGTAPVFENFSNFNFDTHNLIIYFQRYQVAPGAACQVECVNYRVHYSSPIPHTCEPYLAIASGSTFPTVFHFFVKFFFLLATMMLYTF